MIIETTLGFLATMISLVIDTLPQFVAIPTDFMTVLGNITGFGVYIIGADLLLIFAACVTFWTTVKISAGLFFFVWDLLPFT